MKPTIYIIAILGTVLTLMWAAAAEKNGQVERATAPVELTKEMYEAVHVGMSESEVVDMMGEPTRKVKTKTQGRPLNILYWQGYKASVKFTFINGQLTEKLNVGITFEPESTEDE